MENKKTLGEILGEIQAELKAPKGQFNDFAKYKYRSCEDILEAVKPLLAKKKVIITISDDMILLGNRYYVKATATLSAIGMEGCGIIPASAYARESETKKGMDDSQITGAASSYARKYALNGLLLIDDTKDADTQDNTKPATKPATQPKAQQTTQEPTKTEPDKTGITEPQRKRLYAIGKGVGWKDEEMKELIKTFGYEHSKDILRKDYEKICEMLEKGIPGIDKTQDEKPEHTKTFEEEMQKSTDEKVKDCELDELDTKALNLKKELNTITGDDVVYMAILSDFNITQSYELKDPQQKAELVTKLAKKVIELQNEGASQISTGEDEVYEQGLGE